MWAQFEKIKLKKWQKVCRIDLDLRGVLGQGVQSTAVVSVQENKKTFFDYKILLWKDCSCKTFSIIPHKDPMVNSTTNLSFTKKLACMFVSFLQ